MSKKTLQELYIELGFLALEEKKVKRKMSEVIKEINSREGN